jgi:hypothetical protein
MGFFANLKSLLLFFCENYETISLWKQRAGILIFRVVAQRVATVL